MTQKEKRPVGRKIRERGITFHWPAEKKKTKGPKKKRGEKERGLDKRTRRLKKKSLCPGTDNPPSQGSGGKKSDQQRSKRERQTRGKTSLV